MIGVFPLAAGVRWSRTSEKLYLLCKIMRYGSENGQLLTGADPEGTARGREGWVGRG